MSALFSSECGVARCGPHLMAGQRSTDNLHLNWIMTTGLGWAGLGWAGLAMVTTPSAVAGYIINGNTKLNYSIR